MKTYPSKPISHSQNDLFFINQSFHPSTSQGVKEYDWSIYETQLLSFHSSKASTLLKF